MEVQRSTREGSIEESPSQVDSAIRDDTSRCTLESRIKGKPRRGVRALGVGPSNKSHLGGHRGPWRFNDQLGKDRLKNHQAKSTLRSEMTRPGALLNRGSKETPGAACARSASGPLTKATLEG